MCLGAMLLDSESLSLVIGAFGAALRDSESPPRDCRFTSGPLVPTKSELLRLPAFRAGT